MPPSLRFTAALLGATALCAAVSLAVLARQQQLRTRAAAEQLTGGHVDAGKQALGRHACGSCHVIGGVPGADGVAGPALNGIALRSMIAGHLANQPANLVRWLQHPQQVDPGNGMPELPIAEADARDMAAYLYTLKSGM